VLRDAAEAEGSRIPRRWRRKSSADAEAPAWAF
jgi:hypothetical protein